MIDDIQVFHLPRMADVLGISAAFEQRIVGRPTHFTGRFVFLHTTRYSRQLGKRARRMESHISPGFVGEQLGQFLPQEPRENHLKHGEASYFVRSSPIPSALLR